MPNDSFEKAFSDFLDRREYDCASDALFSVARAAFLAGWHAAGGGALPPQPVCRLITKESAETASNP